MFNISTTISGGVTGSRTSIVKTNGEPLLFTDADAQEYIAREPESRKLKGGFSPSGRPLPYQSYSVILAESLVPSDPAHE